MQRKQSDANESNIRTFCSVVWSDPNSSGARTDAAFTGTGLSGAKSHVRVRRVVNTYGPQTMQAQAGFKKIKIDTDTAALPSAAMFKDEKPLLSSFSQAAPDSDAQLDRKGLLPGLNERLGNIEDRLKIASSGEFVKVTVVFARLFHKSCM